MRLSNRVALITGGNRGIGLSTARLFAQEGARVVLFARNQAEGESEAGLIPNAKFIQGDVTKAEDCRQAVEGSIQLFGGLDILVNCAGIIYRNRTVEQTTEEEWDATFDVNVRGTFLMCKYAIPALRERKGCIVSLSSYVGLVGFRGASAVWGIESRDPQFDAFDGARPCKGGDSRQHGLPGQCEHGDDP